MVCPKRTSRAKYDWQGRPYALFLQENERNEVRLERNSRIMVLLQICDLAKQTLCFVSPREREKRSTIGKKQSYNGAAPNL